ncbi:hypothetical protein KFE98_01760 [bacterium SCSIO 12741]|nr:hypothetical protein KFE98_01760 [bacterium SCSIO 12741]
MNSTDILSALPTYGVGILIIILGLFLWWRTKRLERDGTQTDAEIVGFKEYSDEDGKQYFPIVQFYDQEGEVVRQKLKSGSFWKPKEKVIKIIYQKKGSKYEVMKNDYSTRVLVPLGVIVVGALFILGGMAASLGISNFQS